jgi:hypothetical protein
MSADDKAVRAQRTADVAALRIAGATYRAIAAELGISASAAWGYYEEWCNELRRGDPDIQEAAKEALWGQLGRIRAEREAVAAVLTAKHLMVSNGVVARLDGEPIEDDAPVLTAVDRLIKLDDQEAKLLGIYAEKKVGVAGALRIEFTGLDGAELS